jgi:hypothetical protein
MAVKRKENNFRLTKKKEEKWNNENCGEKEEDEGKVEIY